MTKQKNLIFLASILSSLALAACVVPSEGSDNPGVGGGGPDAQVAPSCSPTTVQSTIFEQKCAGACHGASSPAMGLDLVSPGLADRIANRTSDACGGLPLVVPGDPATSYLLAKLAPNPTCGEQMPAGGAALSAEEYDCVSDWIALMPESGGGDGGGDDGGGGTGGGGGGGGW
jgi:hypothetical protein